MQRRFDRLSSGRHGCPWSHSHIGKPNRRQAFDLIQRGYTQTFGRLVVCLEWPFVHEVGDLGIAVAEGFLFDLLEALAKGGAG